MKRIKTERQQATPRQLHHGFQSASNVQLACSMPEDPPDEADASAALSPRRCQVVERIRAATAESVCPVLTSVRQNLPDNFAQPDASEVRLFHLAIQDHCWRLIIRLAAQFPTLVLHHYFDEAPLICAIRSGWEDVALWLVEHGASINCAKMLFDCRQSDRSSAASYDWYEVSAREMAYEKRMLDLLEVLDYLTGNYFAYLKPPKIAIRMLRPQKFPDQFDDFDDLPSDFFTDSYVKPPDKKEPRRIKKKVTKEPQTKISRPRSGKAGGKAVSVKNAESTVAAAAAKVQIN